MVPDVGEFLVTCDADFILCDYRERVCLSVCLSVCLIALVSASVFVDTGRLPRPDTRLDTDSWT